MEQSGEIRGNAGFRENKLALPAANNQTMGYACARKCRNLAMIVTSLAVLFLAPIAHSQAGDPVRGEKLVNALGCLECHTIHGVGGGEVKAPEWVDVFGTLEALEGGDTALVDEAYLRESIQNPDAKVVKGYPAGKMPAKFKFLPEPDLAGMVAYIKSLTVIEGTEVLPGTEGDTETESAAIATDSGQLPKDAASSSNTPSFVFGLFAVIAVCGAILGKCPPKPRCSVDVPKSRKPWRVS